MLAAIKGHALSLHSTVVGQPAILAFELTEAQSISKLQVFIPLLHDSVESCLTVVVETKVDRATGADRQVSRVIVVV